MWDYSFKASKRPYNGNEINCASVGLLLRNSEIRRTYTVYERTGELRAFLLCCYWHAEAFHSQFSFLSRCLDQAISLRICSTRMSVLVYKEAPVFAGRHRPSISATGYQLWHFEVTWGRIFSARCDLIYSEATLTSRTKMPYSEIAVGAVCFFKRRSYCLTEQTKFSLKKVIFA